jgi:hypothetical protein
MTAQGLSGVGLFARGSTRKTAVSIARAVVDLGAVVAALKVARSTGQTVVMVFGAHTGLAPETGVLVIVSGTSANTPTQVLSGSGLVLMSGSDGSAPVTQKPDSTPQVVFVSDSTDETGGG